MAAAPHPNMAAVSHANMAAVPHPNMAAVPHPNMAAARHGRLRHPLHHGPAAGGRRPRGWCAPAARVVAAAVAAVVAAVAVAVVAVVAGPLSDDHPPSPAPPTRRRPAGRHLPLAGASCFYSFVPLHGCGHLLAVRSPDGTLT
eukprot:2794440-Prymnesium_polylepis.2